MSSLVSDGSRTEELTDTSPVAIQCVNSVLYTLLPKRSQSFTQSFFLFYFFSFLWIPLMSCGNSFVYKYNVLKFFVLSISFPVSLINYFINDFWKAESSLSRWPRYFEFPRTYLSYVSTGLYVILVWQLSLNVSLKIFVVIFS